MKLIYLWLLMPFSILASSQEEKAERKSVLVRSSVGSSCEVLRINCDLLQRQIESIDTTKKNPLALQQLQQTQLQIVGLLQTTLKVVQTEHDLFTKFILENLEPTPEIVMPSSSSSTSKRKKKRHHKKRGSSSTAKE